MTVGWQCELCDQGAVTFDEHEAFAEARWHDVQHMHSTPTAGVVTFEVAP